MTVEDFFAARPGSLTLHRDQKVAMASKGVGVPGVDFVEGAGHVTVARVDRVVQVFRSFEDADRADDQFYAELTPQERLDMLLELVERHRSALGEAAGRFERVHCVTELSRR